MQIIQVVSSNISRFAWFGGFLYIEFVKTRAVYEYTGVTEVAFEAFRKADSLGSHFHAQIKNKYPTRLLPVSEARMLGFEEVAATVS